jgi:energy-coupling factor transporter ATP-binding protein EcfA2
VALAAVLAMQPKVLILDEPTSMLDPVSRMRIFDVLVKLKKEQHNTIIAIEHSLENLIPLTDRMVLLSEGELILDEATPAFFQNIDQLLEKGIIPPGGMLFFHELAKAGEFDGQYPLNVEDAYQQLKEYF